MYVSMSSVISATVHRLFCHCRIARLIAYSVNMSASTRSQSLKVSRWSKAKRTRPVARSSRASLVSQSVGSQSRARVGERGALGGFVASDDDLGPSGRAAWGQAAAIVSRSEPSSRALANLAPFSRAASSRSAFCLRALATSPERCWLGLYQRSQTRVQPRSCSASLCSFAT